MKKHWLRGLLLGVSMALLLAGGVALARTPELTVSVDQECVECWPYVEPDEASFQTHELPPPEYIVELTIGGWTPGYELCQQVIPNGAWGGRMPEGDPSTAQHRGFFLICAMGGDALRFVHNHLIGMAGTVGQLQLPSLSGARLFAASGGSCQAVLDGAHTQASDPRSYAFAC